MMAIHRGRSRAGRASARAAGAAVPVPL